MITVSVKAYANLRKQLGSAGSVQLQVEPGTSIEQILDRVRIPKQEARLIFLNGRAAKPDAIPADGAHIDLFSAVGGG